MNPSEPTPPARPADRRRWLPSPVAITGLVLVGLVGYGLMQFGGPDSQDQQEERDAVARCWSEARSPSGSAMDQRNKIAECELKESALRKKFGGTNP